MAEPVALHNLDSPDRSASGFTAAPVDPLRYDVNRLFDPDEVTGIVAGMLSPGARVLDVGCGAGALARVLCRTCSIELMGVEPEAARAERARSYGLNVRTGYLTPLLLREIGLFDFVLLADVLEHLSEPQSLLILAREALRKNGSLIVSVPNVAHWSVRLCLARGVFDYAESGIMDATHLRWFTKIGACKLLQSSGLSVVEYRGAVGQGIPDNERRAPLRWVPARQRYALLRLGSRRWPTVFAAQHVFRARAV